MENKVIPFLMLLSFISFLTQCLAFPIYLHCFCQEADEIRKERKRLSNRKSAKRSKI